MSTLEALGITRPTDVQQATIAAALEGRDLAVEAPTGSGKTIAYSVPIVMRAAEHQRAGHPLGMVVAPTRELARQILHDLRPMAAALGVRAAALTGGRAFDEQIEALSRGVDIVVVTPGRVLDLAEQGHAVLDQVATIVIDEADRLADLGFLPQTEALLARCAPMRQVMLFSATLGGGVAGVIDQYLRTPVRVQIAPTLETAAARHLLWLVRRDNRADVVADLVGHAGTTIAFCRTRNGVDALGDALRRRGIRPALLHGGNTQPVRSRALESFRRGDAAVLVATDVAARGLHVDRLACVVHVDLPDDPSDYVHRSGRTARAGEVGVVIGFVDPAAPEVAHRFLERLMDAHPEQPFVHGLTAELPDLGDVESAADRMAIDREVAALAEQLRPGAVGSVRFRLG